MTDTLWQRLDDWAKSKPLPHDVIFLGIAQDAPGVTAPERLRFDAAVVVPEPPRCEIRLWVYQTVSAKNDEQHN